MAIANIINDDDRCFLYSVLAASHFQKKNFERVAQYKHHLSELNVQGLDFPVKINQIRVFEENNPDYSVNVVYPNSDDKTFVPLYASRHRGRKHREFATFERRRKTTLHRYTKSFTIVTL